MWRRSLWVIVSVAALSLAMFGCKGAGRPDPILSLSAPEAMEQGKAFLEKEKYARARPFLIHAFEVEPNSKVGREALLLAADTFYLEGGTANYIQAEAKYRDFLNRFPTSDRASYAQFQVASTLARRLERPDRDQSTTRKALTAFEDLLRQYPTSEFAAQARDEMRLLRDNLAEHEVIVGRFYIRYGIGTASVKRLENVLTTYPEYSQKDKALFYLGRAYTLAKRPEDARSTFERLRTQHPDSPYVKEIGKLPEPKAAEAPAPVASGEKGGA